MPGAGAVTIALTLVTGQASGDGLLDARDVSALQLCTNGLGLYGPLCDANANGLCEVADFGVLVAARSGQRAPGCTPP
jgi:hypothetical protein